ncbi:hypothetical protein SAMN05444421_11264 [Celeribacter marinus]|nr:hypothetical protein SAMN05444421_11264 [Celeribacter marinus]
MAKFDVLKLETYRPRACAISSLKTRGVGWYIKVVLFFRTAARRKRPCSSCFLRRPVLFFRTVNFCSSYFLGRCRLVF